MAAQKFDPGTYYEISVESADGNHRQVLKLFDTTVSLAMQIERMFESFTFNPDYKKYSVIKIMRK